MGGGRRAAPCDALSGGPGRAPGPVDAVGKDGPERACVRLCCGVVGRVAPALLPRGTGALSARPKCGGRYSSGRAGGTTERLSGYMRAGGGLNARRQMTTPGVARAPAGAERIEARRLMPARQPRRQATCKAEYGGARPVPTQCALIAWALGVLVEGWGRDASIGAATKPRDVTAGRRPRKAANLKPVDVVGSRRG